jgi:hypothetical protein
MVGLIHQGRPWTATGPAALVVAGMMADERGRSWNSAGSRPDLLAFLISRKLRDEPKAVEF